MQASRIARAIGFSQSLGGSQNFRTPRDIELPGRAVSLLCARIALMTSQRWLATRGANLSCTLSQNANYHPRKVKLDPPILLGVSYATPLMSRIISRFICRNLSVLKCKTLCQLSHQDSFRSNQEASCLKSLHRYSSTDLSASDLSANLNMQLHLAPTMSSFPSPPGTLGTAKVQLLTAMSYRYQHRQLYVLFVKF